MLAQDVISRQEKDLDEEKRRQKDIQDEQGRTIASLEATLEKRQATITQAKKEASV